MNLKTLQELNFGTNNKILKVPMTPNSQFTEIIDAEFEQLVELNLENVENLYTIKGRSMIFRHESNVIVSKSEIKLEDTNSFELTFKKRTIFDCGINYMGKLKLEGNRQCYIRVPGEGTFDPASIEPYLSKKDFTIITGFIYQLFWH
jgi:hypothetical protein